MTTVSCGATRILLQLCRSRPFTDGTHPLPHVAYRQRCGVWRRGVECYWHAFCSRHWESDDAERCEASVASRCTPSSPEMQALCRPRVTQRGHVKEILCGTTSPPR
jgi:hypothetical protein